MKKYSTPNLHQNVIKKIMLLKEKRKTLAHLQIPHKLLDFILKIEEVNSTAKLIIINLLKRQNWKYEHLYVSVSYQQFMDDMGLKKGAISHSIKQLKESEFIGVMSGTENKEKIREIKEMIYKQTQKPTRSFNELNIYDLSLLYEKYFTYLDNKPSDTQ